MFPLIKREENQDYQSVNQYDPINIEFPSNSFLINPTGLEIDLHQPSYYPSSSSNPNYNNYNPFMPPHMSATALMQKAMNINNNNNKSKDPMFNIIRRRSHQIHPNLALSAAALSSCDDHDNDHHHRQHQEQEQMMMMMMENKFTHGNNSKYYMQQQQEEVPVNYYHHDHQHDHHVNDMMIMPAIAGAGGFNENGIFNGIFNGGIQNPRPSSCYYKDDIGGNGGNEGLTRDFLGLTLPFGSSREQCDNFFMGNLDQKQQMGSSTYQNL